MPTMTPADLLDELAGDNPPVVLDVRTPKEFAEGHLDGALNIPVDEVRSRIDEVPADRPVAAHCAGGYRSYLAQRILMNAGRENVRNVTGGWSMIERVRAVRRPQ
ncbi:MAG: rhodanese-like domain-containing protein [Planctomycetota bacterium]|jgi:rhodanese-related sulfurtransferase